MAGEDHTRHTLISGPAVKNLWHQFARKDPVIRYGETLPNTSITFARDLAEVPGDINPIQTAKQDL